MNNQMPQFVPQQPAAPKKAVDKEKLLKAIRILCLAALLALFVGTLNPLIAPVSSSSNMVFGYSVINYTAGLADKVNDLYQSLNDKIDDDYIAGRIGEYVEMYMEDTGLTDYTIQLIFTLLVMASLIVVVVGGTLSFKKSKSWPLLTAIGALGVAFFSLIDAIFTMASEENFTFFLIPILFSWAIYVILAIFCFKYIAENRTSAVTYAMPSNASYNMSQQNQPPMPIQTQYQAPVNNTVPMQPQVAAPAPAPMPESAPRVCQKCGQPLNDGFIFCTSCGTKN